LLYSIAYLHSKSSFIDGFLLQLQYDFTDWAYSDWATPNSPNSITSTLQRQAVSCFVDVQILLPNKFSTRQLLLLSSRYSDFYFKILCLFRSRDKRG